MTDSHSSSPLVHMAIEPKSKADQAKLYAALQRLTAENPSLHVSADAESGQVVLEGMSEQHLDGVVDTLQRIDKVDANIGAPQAVCHERITRKVTVDYTHKKQAGHTGQFAAVKIIAEPLPPGTGFEFVNEIIGGAVPSEYIPGVEKGLESALAAGIVAGFPVIDLKVTLIDGKYHDVDSSAPAFEIAARMALRDAMQKAGATLFEPIMTVEAVAPEEYAAAVVRDLDSRRGIVHGQSPRDDAVAIIAKVPLAAMFGYDGVLRAISQGRAAATMQFAHYAPVELPEPPSPFRPAIGMRA